MPPAPLSKPQELLRSFHEWTRLACHVVYHIGAWQTQMEWYDPIRAPWPALPGDFSKTTSIVTETVTRLSSHEIVSFERVRDAALSCVLEKKLDELPPSKETLLELRISESTMEYVAFALLAEDAHSNRADGSQRLLKYYLQYALHIRDRAYELVRVWPAHDDARWRFSNAILPRYTKNVQLAPLAVCMNEAFLNGERAELSPMLKTLDSGIATFLDHFRKQPQGNHMPDSSILDEAVNALLPYLRTFQSDRTKLAGAAEATSAALDRLEQTKRSNLAEIKSIEPSLDIADYMLISKALIDFPIAGVETVKQRVKFLKDHPEIKTFKPSSQRLFVHIADWINARDRLNQSGDADPSPDEIESRKRPLLEAKKRAGK